MNKKKEEEDNQPSKPHAGHISHQCLAAAEVTGRQIETAKSHRTPTRDQNSNSKKTAQLFVNPPEEEPLQLQPNCSSTHRKRSHFSSSSAVHRPTGRGATSTPAQLFIDHRKRNHFSSSPAVRRPTGRGATPAQPSCSSTRRKRSHLSSNPAVRRLTGRGATPAPAQLLIDHRKRSRCTRPTRKRSHASSSPAAHRPPEEEPLQPQPRCSSTHQKNSPTASTPASCRNDHPPPGVRIPNRQRTRKMTPRRDDPNKKKRTNQSQRSCDRSQKNFFLRLRWTPPPHSKHHVSREPPYRDYMI